MDRLFIFLFFLPQLLLSQVKLVDKGWDIDFTFSTFHFDRRYLDNLVPTSYNEFNPGVIIQRDFGKYKVGGGYVYNSYAKHSLVTTVGFDYNTKLSLNVGIMTGYKNTDMDRTILPTIMLSYDFGFFKFGISPIFMLSSVNFEL